MVTVMLRCGDIVPTYTIVICDKTVMSKIKIATKVINALPFHVTEGYVLCDSWNNFKALFKASKSRKYTYIGKSFYKIRSFISNTYFDGIERMALLVVA